MVASIAFGPQVATITPPVGWTLIRRTDNASTIANSLAVYWKTAGNAEPASYAWTFNASTGAVGGILSFVNVDTANPIDAENGQATASALTHTAPSVTTTRADEMVLSMHAFSSSAGWTPPAGMTEVVDVASETVLACCGEAMEANYRSQSSAGATGTMTATASSDADAGVTQTVALRPATASDWLTLTRNNTVDSADVGWFVVQFDPGPGFKVGSFTKSTGVAPASQVIAHGLGSVPKAIILWTDGQTNSTLNNASYLFGYGMTDGTTSRSVAAGSQDGQNKTDGSTRMAGKALTLVQGSEQLVAEADLSSWDDTNFTLNWTTNDAVAYTLHYIVIGGPDVSAKVLDWTMATAAGNQAVTGVGFQPNAVIHAHGTHLFTGALGTSAASAGLGLGAMDADGDQWASSFLSVDNAAKPNTQRGQRTDAALFAFDAALVVQKKASWVSMDADGFTVNFSHAASAAAARVFSLALKGVNVKPGSFNKAAGAAPAAQAITGVGFQPSVVMLSSVQDVTQAAPQTYARFGLGASDGTTQGSSALTEADGVNKTVVNSIDKTTKAFLKVNSTAALNAEADLTSLDADGFTLNWTTNDAVQTEILYLALAHRGDRGAGGVARGGALRPRRAGAVDDRVRDRQSRVSRLSRHRRRQDAGDVGAGRRLRADARTGGRVERPASLRVLGPERRLGRPGGGVLAGGRDLRWTEHLARAGDAADRRRAARGCSLGHARRGHLPGGRPRRAGRRAVPGRGNAPLVRNG